MSIDKISYENQAKPYESTFFVVPSYILRLEGVTLQYIKVFEAVFQSCNNGGSCFISNRTITERTGVTERGIYKSLAWLEKNEALTRIVINGKRHFIIPNDPQLKTGEQFS